MLKKLKLDGSILGDIDKELQVPKDWVEKAKVEGKLRITGSGFQPDLIRAAQAPFRERYPFVAIDYSSPGHEVRAVKTLVAYKTGRIITDIVSGLGGTIYQYREANALEDLRALPNWKSVVDGAKDPGGFWVGIETLHWCMAYNTKLVKKEELPKRWEDLLANPRWRGGNLALANRPQLWALPLWAAKGENWTKGYLGKLFAELKPQLRKEDMRALLQLAAAGEFQAVIPEAGTMTYKASLTGAPIGFTCPEPVPIAVEENVILKGAGNGYAAKLFLNWQLSREGQLAQFAALQYAPVHRDLQRPEFIPFADQVLGKASSYRAPGLEIEVMPKLEEFWNKLWLGGGREK
jgi:iron(III) transport system substrate-binding protein